jgi:6-phosphogluconolactonase
MFVYVGTSTEPGGAEGIYVYRMDPTTGALTRLHTISGLNSPTWVALHPTRPFLYAVERQVDEEGLRTGAVTAFAIDESSGALAVLNRKPSCGVSPPYVSVHPSGHFAFCANYGSGHVASLPIREDGHLGDAVTIILHEGSSVHPQRQTGPHAHFISPDPSGNYVLACDLGLDKVMIYRVNQSSGALMPNDPPFAQLQPGAGTRHLAFHPSGRHVYVINEIDSTIGAFAYDPGRGAMTHLQTISTLPAGFDGTSHTAQIVVHPNGRFVYGSNRGHDSIAIFAVDQLDGTLTPAGHVPTQGRTPRNFNLDPSATFLYAANQNGNTIVTFRVDAQTGALTPTGQVTENPGPTCIVFRPS